MVTSVCAAQRTCSVILRTASRQLRRILLRSWINVLLACVPVGFALNAYSLLIPSLIVNSIAAIPVLGLGDVASEEITLRIGPMYGSLVYISTRYVPMCPIQMLSRTDGG